MSCLGLGCLSPCFAIDQTAPVCSSFRERISSITFACVRKRSKAMSAPQVPAVTSQAIRFLSASIAELGPMQWDGTDLSCSCQGHSWRAILGDSPIASSFGLMSTPPGASFGYVQALWSAELKPCYEFAKSSTSISFSHPARASAPLSFL